MIRNVLRNRSVRSRGAAGSVSGLRSTYGLRSVRSIHSLRRFALGVAWLGASAVAAAQTQVLDFSGFGNYQFVPQTYGDVTGLNLTWSNPSFSATLAPKISVSDYAGGTNVAWADGTSENFGRIKFDLSPGYQVTLNSFDMFRLTSQVNSPWNMPTYWRVLSLDGQVLFGGSGLATNTPFRHVLNYTATESFILQWGDQCCASGIDNISYTVTPSANLDIVTPLPIPEPGTYAMLLAGLAAVGFTARRRGALAARA